jgi:hypothetical protein
VIGVIHGLVQAASGPLLDMKHWVNNSLTPGHWISGSLDPSRLIVVRCEIWKL